MPVSIALIRQLDNLEPKLRSVLLSLLEEMEKQRIESVSKVEFNELKEIVKDLAEAQKNTEKRLEALARAQERTEEKVEKLTERVDNLAQRLEDLAEAQRKTEHTLTKLITRVDNLEVRLEGISNSVGYLLENKSYSMLPELLKERFGLEIKDKLCRKYVKINNKYIQVNVYGIGEKDKNEIIILGECKVRPSKREIDRFEKYARKIGEIENKPLFLLFVAHDYHPKIEEYLKEKNFAYFWSYELEE